jgi:hypothetical protein
MQLQTFHLEGVCEPIMNDATSIPKQICHECGYQMDTTAHAFGDSRPKEGDISMCLACGAVSKFTKELTMRKPTDEEQRDIDTNKEVIAVRLARDHVVGNKIKERMKQ